MVQRDRSILVTLAASALLICGLSACDLTTAANNQTPAVNTPATVVERVTQLESMPERACVVRSLGELQKIEEVNLWEFSSPDIRTLPTATQIAAASAEQGVWPTTLNATSTVRGEAGWLWLDVFFHEMPAGPRMTMNFNDSESALRQGDITTTLRRMRKLETLILQVCGIKAKSPAQETCAMNPALKCT
jgi:hypothetical protein